MRETSPPVRGFGAPMLVLAAVVSVALPAVAWSGEAPHPSVTVACVPVADASPEIAKDLNDSAQDLKKAVAKRKGLVVVEDPAAAQVRVEVLDRQAGAFHSAPGILAIRDMQLRFRISLGSSSSWEESVTGEQTFRRAAENAAKRIEKIVATRYAEIAQR